MLSDFRFAIRSFRRTPLLVGAAILATALGVGANTAIFSVIEAVILKPLPYRDPGHLVMLWEKNPVFGGMLAERLPVAPRNFLEWKREAASFSGVEAVQFANFDLTGGDRPEEVPAALVTPGLFGLFGRSPLLGHAFSAAESDAVLLGYDLWRRRFNKDPNIVGRKLTAGGKALTVTGVLPADFHLPSTFQGMEPSRADLWVPLPPADRESEFARRLYVFGRLRPGVTIAAARAEMTALAGRHEARFKEDTKFSASVFPVLTEDLSAETVRTVWALQVAVGFVLLIACANVANLLLARAAGRSREMAIRAAVGASRGRLVRQAFAESLLLGAWGGGLGVVLAGVAMRGIASFAPKDNYHFHEIALDWTVLLFAAGVAIASGLLFGVAPALAAAAGNLRDALVSDARSGVSRGAKRFRSALVVGEVAAAVVLLAGAGLMIRSLQAVLQVRTGFDSAHVLTAHVRLPDHRYNTPAKIQAFCNELLDRAARIPGVEAASIGSSLPMMDSLRVFSFRIPGDDQARETDAKMVSENYFRTAGMPILQGRGFTSQEALQDGAYALVVNQAFARAMFPGVSPIGRSITIGNEKPSTVIGVVADTHELGLETPIRAEIYLPTRKVDAMAVMLRTKGDPMSLTNALTAAIWSIDKDQPVVDIRSLDDHLRLTTEQRRFDTLLFGGLAGLALLLAAVGVYGVLSYSVLLRTREIGVRIALGAQSRDVLRLVLGNGMKLAGAGVAIGAAGAFALTSLMRGIVFGVSPSDPAAFATAAAVLILVAVAACYIPARRAASVDPLQSLRAD
jgi:putative ABC transport system permease protein